MGERRDDTPREAGGCDCPHRDWVEESTDTRVRWATPLTAGLGLRRFFRLHLDGPPHTAILRIEAPEDPAGRPAGQAPEPPLEPLRRHLARAGLPVPRSYGCDPSRGLDLLEDLGDETLERFVGEAPTAERRLVYAETVALVPRLQRVADAPEGLDAFRRRLDADVLAYKGRLFARHSLPLAFGRAARAAEAEAVRAGFAALAAQLAGAPQRLAHRDLQSRNVLLRPGPDGQPRPFLIDLQGAWLAPPEYDLVCLLRDSYVELPDDEVEGHLRAVRALLPDAPDAETLRVRFDLLTLARKAKDHARFLYALETRGDGRFADHLPATARALHEAALGARGIDPRLDRLCELVLSLPTRLPPQDPERPSCEA